jgi:chromosome segregation ATPase
MDHLILTAIQQINPQVVNENIKLKEENTKLHDELDKIKSKLNDDFNKNIQHKEHISVLELEIDTLKVENERLIKENNELKCELRKLRVQLDNLEKDSKIEIDILKYESQTSKVEIETLKTESRDSKNEIETLKKENIHLNNTLGYLINKAQVKNVEFMIRSLWEYIPVNGNIDDEYIEQLEKLRGIRNKTAHYITHTDNEDIRGYKIDKGIDHLKNLSGSTIKKLSRRHVNKKTLDAFIEHCEENKPSYVEGNVHSDVKEDLKDDWLF